MIKSLNLHANSNKIAIIDNLAEFSYQDLLSKVYELCQYLKENGVNSNQIIAIYGKYSFDNIALFIALYLNQNTIAMIPNIEHTKIYLDSSNAHKLITLDRKIIDLKTPNPINNKLKNKNGLILFSSATLGKPKAILHDLSRLIDSHKDKKERNLRVLLFLLFDHIGGINSLLAGLISGSTLVIAKDFTPQNICKSIEKFKVNILPTTPSFLNLLLISKEYQNYDLSSLRLITYGTERMNQNLLKRLKSTFKNLKFIQTFGTSETGILRTISKSSSSTRFKLDPNEYKIVDGRLFLRSDTMFLGYLNHDENINQWFDSGDLVDIDKDGFLQILGRSKELINVAGNKLLACEVETCIMELEQISDVIVYSKPSLITGEMVVCDVVSTLNKDETKALIKSHCKAKLERYKVPVKINLVNKINLTNRFKKVMK
ncbi:ANL family adenylate-forming protein [Campylobacter vicugnae]|uniref:ANL family adenylate-forming protein n=1 Tax=Campylobacter vicugnae TaxID=1660076 RepID=UPI00254CC223|nr:fatty acid--CoA ligase family protein [Campylobacter ovis]MDL0105710.1 fatty acid--CoA ligase family protein [Campylobacter ovis]MDL0107270.1 fatty acid--CoA ligase family protein [Campylobacter ovis]